MRRGEEPATARSALQLRRVLSTVALVGFGVASVLFFVAAARPGGSRTGEPVAAMIAALTALVALVDLGVLSRRLRRREQAVRLPHA